MIKQKTKVITAHAVQCFGLFSCYRNLLPSGSDRIRPDIGIRPHFLGILFLCILAEILLNILQSFAPGHVIVQISNGVVQWFNSKEFVINLGIDLLQKRTVII